MLMFIGKPFPALYRYPHIYILFPDIHTVEYYLSTEEASGRTAAYWYAQAVARLMKPANDIIYIIDANARYCTVIVCGKTGYVLSDTTGLGFNVELLELVDSTTIPTTVA